MKKAVYIFVLLFAANLPAQNPVCDSLKLVLKNADNDSIRCFVLNALIENEYDDDIWPVYNKELMQIAELNLKRKNLKEQEIFFYKTQLSAAFGNFGYFSTNVKGDLNEGRDYINKALAIDKEINNIDGIGNAYNSLGFIYNAQGNIPKAIEYYSMSLALMERVNKKNSIATALANLGGIYVVQDDLEGALKNYLRALKIRREINDQNGIANTLNSIGSIYDEKDSLNESLKYYFEALGIVRKTGNMIGISSTLNNIGLLYWQKGKALCPPDDTLCRKQTILKARECYSESMEIKVKSGDLYGEALVLYNLGWLEYNLGNISKAKELAIKCLGISKKIYSPANMSNAAKLLYVIEDRQANWEKSLRYYELHIKMRDSIVNVENSKATIKQQLSYTYDKQSAVDKANHEKELGIASEREQKQRIVSISIGLGLLIVLFLAIFIFNRLRLTSRQKKIIEKQKEIVDLKNHLIEEKQKEIIGSINYAQRIQKAHLPNEKYIDKKMQELKQKIKN